MILQQRIQSKFALADGVPIKSSTLLAWTVVSSVAAIDWIGASRAQLAFDGWLTAAYPLAFAGVVSCYGVGRRIDRLTDLGLFAGLWVAFGYAASILSYCVATAGFPLIDSRLTEVDRMLGLNWPDCFHFIVAHAFLRVPLVRAYDSLLLQVFASVLFFAHTSRRRRNEELFLSAALAGSVTVLFSALMPALGPYGDGAMPPWSRVLIAIRHGAHGPFSLGGLQGIVCTPSYHTVLAILFVYAHRPPSRSFVPVLILNLVMLVAIPFAGHHYLTDVAMGAALAFAAIVLAQKLLARLCCIETYPAMPLERAIRADNGTCAPIFGAAGAE